MRTQSWPSNSHTGPIAVGTAPTCPRSSSDSAIGEFGLQLFNGGFRKFGVAQTELPQGFHARKSLKGAVINSSVIQRELNEAMLLCEMRQAGFGDFRPVELQFAQA